VSAHAPHLGQPILHVGTSLRTARAAMVLLHGRGATADGVLDLAQALDIDGVAHFAPQAAGNTWYPNRFIAPIESNEPGISSAMYMLDDLLLAILEAGIPNERIVLLGFSQGGCLALEYAARHARRYGGVVGLSAGLIGPDGTPRDYPGSFDGAPVFLGCSDADAHIPLPRVHETAEAFTRLRAEVDVRIYPGMGHVVNADELDAVRGILGRLTGRAGGDGAGSERRAAAFTRAGFLSGL
jgi:predicted esterase